MNTDTINIEYEFSNVSGSNFNEQKQLMINILKTISAKLLFPDVLIERLKDNGIRILREPMLEYNDCIRKSKQLLNKLASMNSWGLFYDSYFSWKFSVLKNYTETLKCAHQISNDSNPTKMNLTPIEKTIYKQLYAQNDISSAKLSVYLLINKIDGKYKIKLHQDEIREMTKEAIEKLLPRCMKGQHFGEFNSVCELEYCDVL